MGIVAGKLPLEWRNGIYRVSLSIKYLVGSNDALLPVLVRLWFLMYHLFAETRVSLTIMELTITKVLSR